MEKDTAWLENLRKQIVEERDATNFDDIVKCYQSGLLRAGFLLAWLMLIESLKRKIVELANKDVKIAINELKTITCTEDALHSNDEVIWKGALKCDLITKEEDCVLEMLWKKRCVMSHPYMPEVSESDFRYMVENSLGRLWYEGHTDFDKSQWKYYLDEAKQEDEVEEQLRNKQIEYWH